MGVRHMLTTLDNPFNPFDQYEDWLAWDESAGYFSNSLLARIALTSEELSDVDQELAIEVAIDEIISEGLLPLASKVSKTSE